MGYPMYKKSLSTDGSVNPFMNYIVAFGEITTIGLAANALDTNEIGEH